MPRPPLDAVKQHIADEIAAAVLMLGRRGLPQGTIPGENPEVVVHQISPTVSLIRIPTPRGSRYFEVKVSEKI